MENKHFIWDDTNQGIILSKLSKVENEIKKDKKTKLKISKSKIFFPHERLRYNFNEVLSFSEQAKFQKQYQRKTPQALVLSDVVYLQDVKDLVIYTIDTSTSAEFLSFIHLPIVDRFLRALILYMQHYLATWTELDSKRGEAMKRIANPLAGGPRVIRSRELTIVRHLLGREYADLLLACQADAKKYHHMEAGKISFAQSKGEKDLRIFEGLIQFAYRVAWIALERNKKDLIELEVNRLFRSDSFNLAARKYTQNHKDWKVPKDEHWILYGEKLPIRKKMLMNSALPYELLKTNCDYRILSIGLSDVKSHDPRIIYLENALLTKEEDLRRLGIKVGILGLPRSEFDSMLIPHTNEDAQAVVEETSTNENKEVDTNVTLLPLYGSDFELTKPFSLNKVTPRFVGNEKFRNESKKKWIIRERERTAFKHLKTTDQSNQF